jgi:hypothetical protein
VTVSYNPPITDTEPNLRCTVADVASHIRARTKDGNGNELGTFTDSTRPTDTQCEEAITNAVRFTHSRVGHVGEGCAELAREAVALGAAADIERSYFPEQSRSDRSVYTFLRDERDAALEGLVACVMGELPGSVSDEEYGAGAGSFGTLNCISGVVHDYYTGQAWPALPEPEPIVKVQPIEGDSG